MQSLGLVKYMFLKERWIVSQWEVGTVFSDLRSVLTMSVVEWGFGAKQELLLDQMNCYSNPYIQHVMRLFKILIVENVLLLDFPDF